MSSVVASCGSKAKLYIIIKASYVQCNCKIAIISVNSLSKLVELKQKTEKGGNGQNKYLNGQKSRFYNSPKKTWS